MSRSAHPAGPRHADVLPVQSRGGAARAGASPYTGVLNPAIWPVSAARQGGVMRLGGVALTDLAAEYGTPAFLLDTHDLRARSREYTQAFAGADVFYAGKAFLSTAVARMVADEGLGIDVCTAGELAIALRAGVAPGRIALHGNNKSAAELQAAVDARIGRIVVDSHTEILRLAEIADASGVCQPVLVRVTVGVEAHTHEFIATAHEDQKFGFSLSNGEAQAAVGTVLREPSLALVGLHSHIGSQIFDTAGFEVAAHRVVGLLARIRDEFGVELGEIDLGGGLGIAYVDTDDPQRPAEIAARLHAIIVGECGQMGIAVPRLAVEPGRAIIGPAMITIYEVGTVKAIALDGGVVRNYVSVDGGMSDNIRTALYDAEYTVVLANRQSSAPAQLSRVVGKHCESGDIVVRDCWLPGDLQPGDLLAVAATGAYCYAMASNYNRVPRPPVVAVTDGSATVIVRRESLDEVMATDVGWDVTDRVSAGVMR